MDDVDDFPHDERAARQLHVLYLAAELAEAIGRGRAVWTADEAESISERLADMLSVLRLHAGK
jgi:NTP pyrophosphatase (non-canonical NTP hydrolase)